MKPCAGQAGRSRRHSAALATGAALALLGVGAAATATAATLTPTAAHLVAATIVPPVFFPSSLQLLNRGLVVGKAEPGDQIVVVFSQQVSQPTLCSSWSNASATENLAGVTVTMANNAGATGNDTLAVTAAPAACVGGFHFGTVDLGSNAYVITANVTFTGSTIALSQTPTTTTVTITLGTVAGAGTLQTVAIGQAAVYTPTATIKDISNRLISTNKSTSATTIQL